MATGIKMFILNFAFIFIFGYSIASAQAIDSVCLQDARDLGRLQTSFLDPLEKGFSHPGIYVAQTSFTDEEIGELNTKLAAKLNSNSAEFQEAFALLMGVLVYDGDLGILTRAEHERFESVVKNIEKNLVWKHFSSLNKTSILRYMMQYQKSMNDLSNFGLDTYPEGYRNGEILIRKSPQKEYTFYEINETKNQFSQSKN